VDALGEAGYRVESATDGLTGLAHFQAGSFDVVLTDLAARMLGVRRRALRQEHARRDAGGAHHRLGPSRRSRAAPRKRVDLMLVKPFRLERVVSVVADALRLRPAR
jgi:two-component system sensor histidine kinase EvgS